MVSLPIKLNDLNYYKYFYMGWQWSNFPRNDFIRIASNFESFSMTLKFYHGNIRMPLLIGWHLSSSTHFVAIRWLFPFLSFFFLCQFTMTHRKNFPLSTPPKKCYDSPKKYSFENNFVGKKENGDKRGKMDESELKWMSHR